MASPEELARLKGNPQTGAVNMPGVDPITEASFQPNGPPDPGKQPQLPPQEITLPDQQIGPGTGNLQVAGEAPSAFPGQPAPKPEVASEAPIQFGSSPLNPIQKLDEDSKAFAQIAEARRNEGKALAQGKLDEAGIHSQSAQEQELRLKASDADMAKARAAAELAEKDIDAKIAKAEAMSIDPKRFWKNNGTAGNIMAAIAIGLGSFGSGLTGGATGNPALTLINNAIEHDIDAQKSDIDNYWKVIKEQKGLVDNAWNRALVMQNYNANAMLAGYKITESKLKSIAAKTDSEVTKAGTERIIAEMQPTINAYRGQTWSTLAALEAEKRKQAIAGQAAAAANLDKLAKERDDQRKGLADKFADPNGDALPYDQALAKADQILDQNPRFDKLAGTRLATPGQKYNTAVTQTQTHYIQLQQGLNNKDPNVKSKTQNLYLKALMDAGLPYEDALKQMKTLQNASPGQLAAQAKLDLNQDGIVSPYEAKEQTSTQTPGIIDVNTLPKNKKALTVVNPNSGEVLTYPSIEAANKAREALVGLGEVKSILAEMKDLRKQNKGGTFDPAQVSHNKVLQARLIGAINQVHGGKLDEGERKAWAEILPDATSHDFINNTDERLDKLESSLTQTANSQLAGGGGQIIGKTKVAPQTSAKPTNTSGDPFTGAGGKSDPFTPINPADTDKQGAGKRNY